MTRRTLFSVPALLPALAASSTRSRERATAISLNEDNSHFFITRSDRRVTEKDLLDWVDQYAGTQVRELILNVCAQRTSFDSKVWTPIWKGYDPAGPDDQPLFASLPPELRKRFRAWFHTAWQMNADGLDHFAVWIRRARQKGLSPWVSIRMNDLHDVDNERHPMHSDFWRAHPEFRRIPYRGEQRDKALDFGREEVREYTFRLIEEVAHRYDFDGLELDWMRHGFHFAPGREGEGREHLNRFMARVRQCVGSRKKIGVRVPPHPESASSMGMDAVAWARAGNADLVVPTNYWRTVDTNMPLRLWRQILPASCLLGGGVELGLNPFPGSKMLDGRPFGFNDLKTVRGVAAAMLEQGADRVYLFNYMDSQTAIENLADYPALLREVGSLETLRGKERRHVVTYTDTWAPGEPSGALLPVKIEAGNWRAFRLAAGPVDRALKPVVRIGVDGDASGWTVRVNGEAASFQTSGRGEWPGPNPTVYTFQAPVSALRGGEAVVELTASATGTVEWVELALIPA